MPLRRPPSGKCMLNGNMKYTKCKNSRWIYVVQATMIIHDTSSFHIIIATHNYTAYTATLSAHPLFLEKWSHKHQLLGKLQVHPIQTLHHMEAWILRSLFQHHFLQDMLKAEDRGKNLKTKLSAMTVGRWGVMLKRWFDLIITSPQLRCLSSGLPFLQKCVNIGVRVCVKNQVTLKSWHFILFLAEYKNPF